jgi:hypothetical protein
VEENKFFTADDLDLICSELSDTNNGETKQCIVAAQQHRIVLEPVESKADDTLTIVAFSSAGVFLVIATAALVVSRNRQFTASSLL